MDSPSTILRLNGLTAKKSWGQCFLHERQVVDRIVAAANISATEPVLEIGAGLGILTEALACTGNRVFAVERDRDLVPILQKQFAESPNVEIVEANALTLNLADFGKRLTVLGNLPYHIASQILFHLIEQKEHVISATLMLQREVAERLVAQPGTKVYGVPSVLCQRVAEVSLCFYVPSGAFWPSPQVESAIVHLAFKAAPLDLTKQFRHVVQSVFRYRRKTLKKALSLSFTKERVTQALERANLDGRRRGETLSIEEYEELTRNLTD